MRREIARAAVLIDLLGSILRTPDITKKEAIYIFIKSYHLCSLKRRLGGVDAVAAASFYIASKKNSPRPLSYIADVVGIKKKFIRRIANHIMKELDIKDVIVKPSDYIPFLVQELGLNSDVRDEALALLDNIKKDNPYSAAISAIYEALCIYGIPITIEKLKRRV